MRLETEQVGAEQRPGLLDGRNRRRLSVKELMATSAATPTATDAGEEEEAPAGTRALSRAAIRSTNPTELTRR